MRRGSAHINLLAMGKSGIKFILALLTILILAVSSSLALDFNVKKSRLENGLTLLLLEDHHAPIVAIDISYRVGTANELRGYTGITRVCERIATYGTERFERGAITRVIRSGGGTNRSFAQRDYTYFREQIPSFLLDSVLIMEADRMQNIEITYEKLVLAKEATAQQRQLNIEGTLYGPLNEELFNLQYRSHPYGNPLYGWPPDLENIGIEDVREYYRRYFIPANAQIVIVGDFDSDEVGRRVEELFGKIISPPAPVDVTVTEPKHSGERKGYIYDRSEVPAVACAYMVPEASERDLSSLQVLNQIMSQGESSRLYRELVADADEAVAVGGGQIPLRGPGMIFFWAIGNFDTRISELEEILLEEIESLPSEPITSAELVKARNQILADYYRSLASMGSTAQDLRFNEMVYGDWERLERGIKDAEKVSIEDVRAAVKKYLIPINRVVVIMKSSDEDTVPSDEDAEEEAGER